MSLYAKQSINSNLGNLKNNKRVIKLMILFSCIMVLELFYAIFSPIFSRMFFFRKLNNGNIKNITPADIYKFRSKIKSSIPKSNEESLKQWREEDRLDYLIAKGFLLYVDKHPNEPFQFQDYRYIPDEPLYGFKNIIGAYNKINGYTRPIEPDFLGEAERIKEKIIARSSKQSAIPHTPPPPTIPGPPSETASVSGQTLESAPAGGEVRTVTDYYLDAPVRLLGMIDDTTGKDLAQGTRSSLIKLRDDHNGYLQVEGNALISKFNLALFNMKDGSHLLGIQEMGGSVAHIRFLRRTPAGQWNDATTEVWPTISQEFILGRFLKAFPKAGKSLQSKVNTRGGSTVYYELPRNGTTIIAKSWIDETEFYGKELFKIRFNRERFEVIP